MSFGLCFWILALLWVVLGLVWSWGRPPQWPAIGAGLIAFLMLVLLGWKVFGAPLH